MLCKALAKLAVIHSPVIQFPFHMTGISQNKGFQFTDILEGSLPVFQNALCQECTLEILSVRNPFCNIIPGNPGMAITGNLASELHAVEVRKTNGNWADEIPGMHWNVRNQNALAI